MTVPTQSLELLKKRLSQLEDKGALGTTAAVLQIAVTPQYLAGQFNSAQLVFHVSPALEREPCELSRYAPAEENRRKVALYRERFGAWRPNVTLVNLTSLQRWNTECYIPGKTTFFHAVGLNPPTAAATALPVVDHTNFILFEDELHLEGVAVRSVEAGVGTSRIPASELRDRIVSGHSAVKGAISC